MRTKTCKICEREFPATTEYFHCAPHDKYGLHRHCKECRNARRRERYKSDTHFREQVKKRARDWLQDNAEYARERSRAYGRAHIAEAIERVQQWRTDHPERYREMTRRNSQQWAKANPEKARAIVLNYQARKRNASGKHTARDIQNLYTLQDGKCVYCGCSLDKGYHVDHVIPLSRGGANSPDNLALSCPFCNCSKGDRLPGEWKPLVGKSPD